MPLMPKRVKYRKTQRGSRKGTASRNLRIDFGEFGLQTLERAWITNTQLEAARVALTRNMKRKGKLWIRIFPDKSVTSRPPETRMGKRSAKSKQPRRLPLLGRDIGRKKTDLPQRKKQTEEKYLRLTNPNHNPPPPLSPAARVRRAPAKWFPAA